MDQGRCTRRRRARVRTVLIAVCEDPFLFLTTTPGPHVLTMRVTGLNGRVEETSLQFVAAPVAPSPAG
jgi:hypothetical protein